jgi:hypothetical protein
LILIKNILLTGKLSTRGENFPVPHRNRIFDELGHSQKIRFFQKIGFLTELGHSQKIRFFQKIGFLTELGHSQKNPIFSKNRIFDRAWT